MCLLLMSALCVYTQYLLQSIVGGAVYVHLWILFGILGATGKGKHDMCSCVPRAASALASHRIISHHTTLMLTLTRSQFYNDPPYQLYNVMYTALPILVLSVLDQELKASVLEDYPQVCMYDMQAGDGDVRDHAGM